jgi:hypothetical protein
MSLPDTVCGVLLVEEAYSFLGEALAPYVKEGRIGKYIYCTSAVQSGSFIDMTFKPEQCDGSVTEIMTISIPLHFVKFMATGRKSLPLGFAPAS